MSEQSVPCVRCTDTIDRECELCHGSGEIPEQTWWEEGMKRNVILVSSEAWDVLQEELNRPPRIIPALVELFKDTRK